MFGRPPWREQRVAWPKSSAQQGSQPRIRISIFYQKLAKIISYVKIFSNPSKKFHWQALWGVANLLVSLSKL